MTKCRTLVLLWLVSGARQIGGLAGGDSEGRADSVTSFTGLAGDLVGPSGQVSTAASRCPRTDVLDLSDDLRVAVAFLAVHVDFSLLRTLVADGECCLTGLRVVGADVASGVGRRDVDGSATGR